MTETNNWELYSSEEEVEQKQNHKKITDHKNLAINLKFLEKSIKTLWIKNFT